MSDRADWNEAFANAHKSSWPTDSLSISRQLFDRDEKLVLSAARRHGYEVLFINHENVSFNRPNVRRAIGLAILDIFRKFASHNRGTRLGDDFVIQGNRFNVEENLYAPPLIHEYHTKEDASRA